MTIEQFSLLNACKPRTTDLRPFDGELTAEPWLWGTPHGGSSEHSPREIAVRRVFKVLTEEIISRGESPRSHTGLSVVRPGGSRQVDGVNNTPLCG